MFSTQHFILYSEWVRLYYYGAKRISKDGYKHGLDRIETW